MIVFIVSPKALIKYLLPCIQGAHVTINARSEMDLDEDEVMKKVSTASGAKFSVHKEKARPMPEAGPIVSTRVLCRENVYRIAGKFRGYKFSPTDH